jgi:release factor glutamine methyltransferase
MQLKAALTSAIEILDKNDIGSPRLNAETLLMFVLERDRAYLYAHPERELSREEEARYRQAIEERRQGRPSQYITGHQEFWGLDLIVSPAVLIPRPETEHVVETVLELAGEHRRRPLKIADVGTGSGCIALALASELAGAEILALDISAPALEIARANAARLNFAGRVSFQQSDLLSTAGSGVAYDFVVCNPPYVSENEPEKVQRQVREFEPGIAVFAGKSGLEIYQRLLPQAKKFLKPGGWLVMEIGYSIEDAVRSLLADWKQIRVTKDLQGIPRVVAAQNQG